MTRFYGDADLAVGLEAANTGAVSRARIDDDKRPSRRIDLDTRRRHNPHQSIVDRLDQAGGRRQQVRLCNRGREELFPPDARDIDCRAAASHPRTARSAARHRRNIRSLEQMDQTAARPYLSTMIEGSVTPALHPILLAFCSFCAATTTTRKTTVTLNLEINKSNPALSQIKCSFLAFATDTHI